jgi:hypothetical protein
MVCAFPNMRKLRLAITIVGVVLLGVSAAAAGQEPLKAGGDTVTVTQSGSGEELHGRLLELSATTLSILVEGRRVDVPIDNVLRIDGHYDSVKNGAIIGAAVMGGLALVACGSLEAGTGWCANAIVVDTGFGALVGAGIDALHKGRTPIYVKAGRSGSALQVRFRF